MALVEPRTLLATVKDSIRVTVTFDGYLRYSGHPAQLVVSELLPDIYGIVVCKYNVEAGAPMTTSQGRVFAIVLDEQMSFHCNETRLTVDIFVYDQEIGSWASQFSIEFSNAKEWYECVRLLNEGKSKHVLRAKWYQEKLATVFINNFVRGA